MVFLFLDGSRFIGASIRTGTESSQQSEPDHCQIPGTPSLLNLHCNPGLEHGIRNRRLRYGRTSFSIYFLTKLEYIQCKCNIPVDISIMNPKTKSKSVHDIVPSINHHTSKPVKAKFSADCCNCTLSRTAP